MEFDNTDFFTAKTVIMSAMFGLSLGISLFPIINQNNYFYLIVNVPVLLLFGTFLYMDTYQAKIKRGY